MNAEPLSVDAQTDRRRLRPLFVAGLIVILITAFLTRDAAPPQVVVSDSTLAAMLPREVTSSRHAQSSDCRECHEHNHSTWHASYHRTMTQTVTPSTVMGDFKDRTIAFPGHEQQYHLELRDGMPWVTLEQPVTFFPHTKLRRKSYPLVLSTGSHHMQLYWLPIGEENTLAIMPIAYLREERRWIPRNATFITPPAHGFAPEIARWNETCIGCHTTFGSSEMGERRNFTSTAAEFGISCEACHGAAGDHITHQRNAAAGMALEGRSDPILNPSRLNHRESAAVCGACHSVQRGEFNGALPPGDVEALASRMVLHKAETERRAKWVRENSDSTTDEATLSEEQSNEDSMSETFWSDGHVRVAGREYSGLIESACFDRGEITCASCHDLHQSRNDPRPSTEWADDMIDYRKSGDQACTDCHADTGFATAKHTHHAPASEGSRCNNCHMPHTSYGLLKAVRTHTISSPSISTDLATGRPNACNLCHLDRSLEWTSQHLSAWYGHERPELSKQDKEISRAAMLALKGDAPQRALIAWHMSWPPAITASGSDWFPPYLGALLKDRYGAVRFIAERSLRKLPDHSDMQYDFLAPTARLDESSAALIRSWVQSTNRSLTSRPEVLLGENGILNRTVFDRLHGQRDDRDINLAE